MAKRTKPNYQVVWASLGDNTKPLDSYIEAGWLAVKPPRQYMNWIQNRQDNMIAYMNQAGVPEWESSTDYEGGFSYVQGSDNKIYKCLADNGPSIVGATNKDPVNQPTNAAFWEVAFVDKGDFDIVEGRVDTLETQMGDGSGVTDAPAWRSELSVYSTSEIDAMTPTVDDSASDALQIGNKAMAWGVFTGPSSGGTTTATIDFSSLAVMANTNYNIQITRTIRGTGTFSVCDAPTVGSKTTTNFVITSSQTIDDTWSYSWHVVGNGAVV
jgi:hypothetical protein